MTVPGTPGRVPWLDQKLWKAVMPNDPKAGPRWRDFMAGQTQGAVRESVGRTLRQAFELPRDLPDQLLTVLAQLDDAAAERENKRDERSALGEKQPPAPHA
jgi:hypothetical protein